MKLIRLGIACLLVASPSWGAVSAASDSQKEYERSVNAIVRQKIYYKAGRIEVGGTAGVMPYDSVVNHVMVGGRLTWHLADHYGWEIIDAQLTFPTIANFTTNLVQSQGIANFQTAKLKLLASTNFLISPFYGKIRFFGRTVLHLDLYFVAGVGMANTEVLRFASGGTAPTQSTVSTGFSPMFDFGLGFRVFLNPAMALNIDFRDYVVSAPVYGSRSFKSNFAVFGGLSFFLPTF